MVERLVSIARPWFQSSAPQKLLLLILYVKVIKSNSNICDARIDLLHFT
jgi:hypothetical protein